MRDKRISSISKKVIPPFIEKLFPSRTAEIQFARWTDTRRIAKDRRLIGVGRFVMDSEGRGRGKGLDSVRLRVTNRIGGKGTGARAMNRGIDLSRLGRSESFFLSFLLPRFLSSPDLCVDLDTAKRSIVPVSPLFALVSSSRNRTGLVAANHDTTFYRLSIFFIYSSDCAISFLSIFLKKIIYPDELFRPFGYFVDIL